MSVRHSTERVAVLGTGIMGGPIAAHLAASGRRVTAWDGDAARREALRDRGVTPCASAAEAVSDAQVVVTMLSDADATATVCAEAFDDFAGLWIQSATVGADGITRLADLADEKGVAIVDSPMLGTRSTAEAGALVALASGPADSEQMARAVLDAYSRQVLWVGEAGRGSELKLVVNNWVIGLTALTAETIALAEGLGFSGDDFLRLIAGGPLDVEQARIKGEMMQSRTFPPALPLRHAAKDARLIQRAALDAGLDLPLAAAVAQSLAHACSLNLADEDMAALFLTLGRTADRPSGAARLGPG